MISTQVKAEAARWLIELDTADHVEDLWPEFEAWINQHPTHRRAFVRVERAWRTLDGFLGPEKCTSARTTFHYWRARFPSARAWKELASALFALVVVVSVTIAVLV
jgi:ferric-dicitrate binding protein FerR (iron transport regulator)